MRARRKRNKTSEKRSWRRRAVLKQATLDFGEGRGEYDCVILDLSAKGARIGIELPTVAPECFELNVADGRRFLCRRVWQHDEAMGVEFVEARARAPHGEDDARRDKRVAVVRRGRIVYNGGYCTMDCHVLDMSASGARVRPIDPITCPEVFQLSVEFGPSRACRIVRYEGEDIGVQFLDRPDAD